MSSKTKTHVFRVRGLPKSWGQKKNTIKLREAIDQQLSNDETRRLSYIIDIVPDCYDEEKKVVALVEFSGASPAFLGRLAGKPGDCEILCIDKHEIAIDRDFFQLTQLNHPKGNPVVDIVAITGLDGHAYGSWRGKREGRMWLRDYLARDFPTCRIMVYGYNTKLAVRSTADLEDYSTELLNELKGVRRMRKSWKDNFRTPKWENLQNRPIIFIAHSFGGLVAARALTLCAKPPALETEWNTLYAAIYGILFFGVPHKGLLTSDILKIIQSQQGARSHPRRKLLKSIELGSRELTKQMEAFTSVVQHRRIVTFHELLQTPSLEWDPVAKRFQRSGDPSSAVPKDSAILSIRETEATIGLHADHSSIVKFESDSEQGYRHTVHWIRKFVKNGPIVVYKLFLQRVGYPVYSSSWAEYHMLNHHNIKCRKPQSTVGEIFSIVDEIF